MVGIGEKRLAKTEWPNHEWEAYMHSVLDKMNKKLLAAEHNNHHSSHAASEFTLRGNLVANTLLMRMPDCASHVVEHKPNTYKASTLPHKH